MSSTTSSVVSATTDGSGATIYTGFGGAAATTGSGANGAEPGSAAAASRGAAPSITVAVLNVGRAFGVMGVVAIVFGGFAMLL